MSYSRLNSLLKKVERPSRYLGNEVNVIRKDFDAASVRVCLVFPDKYEIGMSHVGLKILYDLLNQIPDVVAERCYAPDLDLETVLRQEKCPLFSLESKRPLRDFDIIGFSLTYELTYTNMLAILDLAGIPLWQKDRKTHHPLIIAGGGCTMNAEPVADFLDAACLGDGEELILDVVDCVRQWKKKKENSRHQLLDALSNYEGLYIPSFFVPEYNDDGTLKRTRPLKAGYEKINKRILQNIDKAPYPTKLIVPSIKTIHDRIGIEIQRGCNRACRFCQAGYIDRPVRQRSPETILKIAEDSYRQTGIDEISLLSLSAADYACLVPLLQELNGRYATRKVSLSVPATRTEKMTPELVEQIKKVRKTGFTVAPEAGTERMRRVINKGNKVEDLFRAVHNAFSAGWQLLKLYYLVGIPFETDEDTLGIVKESQLALGIARKYTNRADINTSLSSFVPKPFTPFQWVPQMTLEESKRKYSLVRHNVGDKRIHIKTHHPDMSYLEGIFSRGDRKVARLIYLAFQEGCRFDEWEEHFDFEKWKTAISKWGEDPAFYLHRARGRNEVLPWDHLFAQMDKNFLWDEYEKAHDAAFEGEKDLNPLCDSSLSYSASSEAGEKNHHRPFKKRLPSLPHHHQGFTEDCSTDRCSNCGVCDFREIKNRIFVESEQEIAAKKGHREWYGWQAAREPAVSSEASPVGFSSVTPHVILPPTTFKLRARYSKMGDARFMGHLELMGALKRSITRLQLPVKYSEGFHPQMKLAMSHPLPLGLESDWEFFDLELISPVDVSVLKDLLNETLPLGLSVVSISAVDRKAPSLYSSVRSITYEAIFEEAQKNWPPSTQEALDRFSRQEEWIWRREDKDKVFNLKELVSVDSSPFPESVKFEIQVGPEGTLKPSEVLIGLLGLTVENLDQVRLKKIGVSWKPEENGTRS